MRGEPEGILKFGQIRRK